MTVRLADIPILTYHKITERREFGINTVHPASFENQMRSLREAGYQTVTFDDISKGTIPDKAIIITFDDGYTSVYDKAFPILKSLDFKAVVFIISGYIGRENTWDANLAGITFSHLDASQIKLLSQENFEIGSHGVSHRALPYLREPQIVYELEKSREELSGLIEKPVRTIAYPFGIQNKSVQEMAANAGYQFGCINLWGGRNDVPLCLRRFPVYRADSISALKRKIKDSPFHRVEILKLKILSWPALLTPVYQKFFKKKERSASAV